MGLSMTTDAGDNLILSGGTAALVNPRIDLFSAIANPLNKFSPWADFTIPTYTGYAGPITVTISSQYINNTTGLRSVDIADAIFNGPSSGLGTDVIGWVFHDTTATPVVYAAGMFDGPLSLNASTDRVTVDETLGIEMNVTFSAEN